MALMVRRTKTPGRCKCFEFPKGEGIQAERLCFRANFVGALTDPQMEKYCDLGKSEIFAPETTEVQNIVRTIKEFSVGVGKAKEKYYDKEDFKKDMGVWREEVSRATRKTPIHGLQAEEVYADEYQPIRLPPVRCRIKKAYVPTDVGDMEGWF